MSHVMPKFPPLVTDEPTPVGACLVRCLVCDDPVPVGVDMYVTVDEDDDFVVVAEPNLLDLELHLAAHADADDQWET